MLHYEHRSDPLLPPARFLQRVGAHALVALGFVVVSLAIGILGYHFIAGFPWIDALLNAAMILGGMGEVTDLVTRSGKLFASFYALYAGVAFLAVAAVLVAPFVHRLLHRLHVEDIEKRAQGR